MFECRRSFGLCRLYPNRIYVSHVGIATGFDKPVAPMVMAVAAAAAGPSPRMDESFAALLSGR